MKKISAFFIAILIFVIIITIYNCSLNSIIEQNKSKLYYLINDTKFNNIEAAKACLENEDTVLVLGSSELSSFNTEIMNNGDSNFNMYLIGRGHTQCLQSALTLGAIEEKTNIKKVVLILSPQWFEGTEPINSEIFASRFQKNTFNYFMKNDKISFETKQKVINILKQLESTDELELEKINKYESAYLKYNIIDRIYLSISDNLSKTRQNKKMVELLEDFNNREDSNNQTIKFEEYNFQELLNNANNQGMRECTNNDLGINDSYYDTYIKNNIIDLKNSRLQDDFTNEKEYKYLELFLEICNQLEIQPLIINVPVNGRWYDYIGIEEGKRKTYYNKVIDISKKYNAKIADFSDCEYEKYFLRDIMHVGWKGWVKIDEAIYKYYCEK